MKKLLLILFLSTILIFPAVAGAIRIDDNYVGADPTGSLSGDVIGRLDTFQIESMDVYFQGADLHVDINSVYFSQFAASSRKLLGSRLGELFISTNGWNPFGTAPYADDEAINGEKWELAVDFVDDDTPPVSVPDPGPAPGTTSGNIILREVNNSVPAGTAGSNIILSDTYFSSGYRQRQEVRVNGGVEVGSGGTWGITGLTNDVLSYVITDFDSLGYGRDLGFHWGMTCANDVIEGAVAAPEPTTMLLSGLGLLGMAAFLRRRSVKKA